MSRYLIWLAVIALTGVAELGCATRADVPPGEAAQNARVRQLPLIVRPLPESRGDTLAVMITGDGGWGATDRRVSRYLAEYEIPTVGLSSIKYFWTKRTPEGASADLACLLRHYIEAWHKDKVILIGYSFGADVLPYMVSRLPEDLQRRVILMACLGPSTEATFQFKFADWIPGKEREDGHPTKPEVERVRRVHGLNVLCVYGSKEKHSLCPQLDPADAKLIKIPTAHHFHQYLKPIVAELIRTSAGTPYPSFSQPRQEIDP